MRLTCSDIVLNFSPTLTEKVLDCGEHDPCHVTAVPNARRSSSPPVWPFTTGNCDNWDTDLNCSTHLSLGRRVTRCEISATMLLRLHSYTWDSSPVRSEYCVEVERLPRPQFPDPPSPTWNTWTISLCLSLFIPISLSSECKYLAQLRLFVYLCSVTHIRKGRTTNCVIVFSHSITTH